MPLPEKVINQLGREPVQTPGWSFGLLLFSAGIFFIVGLIYCGLAFVYEPMLQGKINQNMDQITKLEGTLSANDQINILNYYSQISNIRSLLRSHVGFNLFFSWLENNTETNVTFQSFQYSAYQVSLGGVARNETDVNQQIAIFENSPQVKSVSVGGLQATPAGTWQFTVKLVVNPSLLSTSSQ